MNEGATRGLKRSPPLFCPSAFSSQPLAFLSRLPSFPLLPPPGRGTPIIFQLRQTFGRASPSAPLLMQRCRGREGDPGRPKGGRSAKAGADITPATGRGRFAPMPHATRGGRGTANSRDYFRSTEKRGVRGCRGCRGGTPLTPCPAPGRRPAARSGQPPQDKEEKRKGFSV